MSFKCTCGHCDAPFRYIEPPPFGDNMLKYDFGILRQMRPRHAVRALWQFMQASILSDRGISKEQTEPMLAALDWWPKVETDERYLQLYKAVNEYGKLVIRLRQQGILTSE